MARTKSFKALVQKHVKGDAKFAEALLREGVDAMSNMKKKGSAPNSGRKVGGSLTLGRDRFGKISAVEGIVLTRDMKKRAAEFDRQGLSAEQRRRSIVNAHRKG